MMDDEKDNPELLIEDLKAGGSTPGPRMQRLATASGESEQEVGLFLMQFEVRLPSPRPFPWLDLAPTLEYTRHRSRLFLNP